MRLLTVRDVGAEPSLRCAEPPRLNFRMITGGQGITVSHHRASTQYAHKPWIRSLDMLVGRRSVIFEADRASAIYARPTHLRWSMRSRFAAAILSASMLTFNVAIAQFGQQPPAAQAGIDSASQATVDRLGSLNVFPVTGWRFHSADLAHGEDPKLDDASWPLAKTPRNRTDHEAVWYRSPPHRPEDAQRLRPYRSAHLASLRCRRKRPHA